MSKVECVVCLNNISTVKFVCSHSMCEGCFNRMHRTICPSCAEDIKVIKVVDDIKISVEEKETSPSPSPSSSLPSSSLPSSMSERYLKSYYYCLPLQQTPSQIIKTITSQPLSSISTETLISYKRMLLEERERMNQKERVDNKEPASINSETCPWQFKRFREDSDDIEIVYRAQFRDYVRHCKICKSTAGSAGTITHCLNCKYR
jgi:hypothetical protein